MVGRVGRGDRTRYRFAGEYRHRTTELREALANAEVVEDFEAIVRQTLLWDPRHL